MRKCLYIIVVLLSFKAHAQNEILKDTTLTQPQNDTRKQKIIKRKTVVKINAFSLLLNNYSFSIERLISKRVALQFGFRYGPYNYLIDNPIGKQVVKRGGGDPKYYGFQVGNSAVTTDVKYHIGRKGLRGFFVGGYGRFVTYDADQVDFNFVPKTNTVYSVPLVSNMTAFLGGITYGYQWIIVKRVAVEFSYGFHYGLINGSLSSKKDLSALSSTDKDQLKEDVESIFLYAEKNLISTLNIDDNGLRGKISGPLIGFRAALNIGIAF